MQTLVLMMVIGKSVSTVQHHRESLSLAVTVTHTATVGCTVLSASHACPRPVAPASLASFEGIVGSYHSIGTLKQNNPIVPT